MRAPLDRPAGRVRLARRDLAARHALAARDPATAGLGSPDRDALVKGSATAPGPGRRLVAHDWEAARHGRAPTAVRATASRDQQGMAASCRASALPAGVAVRRTDRAGLGERGAALAASRR